jgi:hypothetical protein
LNQILIYMKVDWFNRLKVKAPWWDFKKEYASITSNLMPHSWIKEANPNNG